MLILLIEVCATPAADHHISLINQRLPTKVMDGLGGMGNQAVI
jgi:hypothetical protein